MDDFSKTAQELVHLARLALAGRDDDVSALARRLARRLREDRPELSAQLLEMIPQGGRPDRVNDAPLREYGGAPLARGVRGRQASQGHEAAFAPVDLDSRLDLVRTDWDPRVPVAPIWPADIRRALEQLVAERGAFEQLAAEGLVPTRTVLFAGPPGVGKTLAAQWVAQQLGRSLIVLDLATVMSSFLGRTGTNLRHVMDYAKSVGGVLLLDEIDALAKRRDDQHEVGELKRLVTALLQEIDAWPSDSLLIAATNHPALLDPAAWRRFELQLTFELPAESDVAAAVRLFLGDTAGSRAISGDILDALSVLFRGRSYSDIERELTHIRRATVLGQRSMSEELIEYVRGTIGSRSRQERVKVALALSGGGLSQREVHNLTGVSRDTIRKAQHRDEVADVATED